MINTVREERDMLNMSPKLESDRLNSPGETKRFLSKIEGEIGL